MQALAAANFSRPKGTNFSSPDEVPSVSLARSLCRIASFLQDLYPYIKLQRYWDLWEEDGEHYYKEQTDFHGLFEIVESPRNLMYALMDGNVFVGIAPHDNSCICASRWTGTTMAFNWSADLTSPCPPR